MLVFDLFWVNFCVQHGVVARSTLLQVDIHLSKYHLNPAPSTCKASTNHWASHFPPSEKLALFHSAFWSKGDAYNHKSFLFYYSVSSFMWKGHNVLICSFFYVHWFVPRGCYHEPRCCEPPECVSYYSCVRCSLGYAEECRVYTHFPKRLQYLCRYWQCVKLHLGKLKF